MADLVTPAQRQLTKKWFYQTTPQKTWAIYTEDGICVAWDVATGSIAEYIVDEHNKALDAPGYDRHTHLRMVEATQVSARLYREVENLQDTIKASKESKDMPLWRRIAMQRREIKALNAYVEMYRKWWREEKNKNNESRG